MSGTTLIYEGPHNIIHNLVDNISDGKRLGMAVGAKSGHTQTWDDHRDDTRGIVGDYLGTT